jgi:hypothetical protein
MSPTGSLGDRALPGYGGPVGALPPRASKANGDDENAARRRPGAKICSEFLARDTRTSRPTYWLLVPRATRSHGSLRAPNGGALANLGCSEGPDLAPFCITPRPGASGSRVFRVEDDVAGSEVGPCGCAAGPGPSGPHIHETPGSLSAHRWVTG